MLEAALELHYEFLNTYKTQYDQLTKAEKNNLPKCT